MNQDTAALLAALLDAGIKHSPEKIVRIAKQSKLMAKSYF